MKMQWGRRNEDGSGSSGALIILVLRSFIWCCDDETRASVYVTDISIYLYSSSEISWLWVSANSHAEFVVAETNIYRIKWRFMILYLKSHLPPNNAQLCSVKSFHAIKPSMIKEEENKVTTLGQKVCMSIYCCCITSLGTISLNFTALHFFITASKSPMSHCGLSFNIDLLLTE